MRALVIQDEDVLSRSMAKIVNQLGFEVVESAFGEDGLEFAQVYLFDIICVDDNLPDLSGFDILRRLRMCGCDAPTVFVSSAAHEPDVARRARALGAKALLGLPFQAAEFARIVGDLHHAARGFGPYEPGSGGC